VLEEGFLTSPDFMERKFAPTDIRSRLPWVKPEYREGLRRAFEIWEPIRAAHNCSFSVLTEAWALAQCELMNLLVGMRRPQSVADTAKCVDIELTPEELRVMEESVQDIRVDMEDK